MRRAGVRLLAALAVCTAMAGTADAQTASRTCRQLEAQLASAGSGNSRQASRYDAAIARQQEEMRKARDQARRAGCGRSIFGSSVAACGSLNATLDKMQRNLLDLQGKRAKMGGGNGRRDRARIEAALKTNGCRQEARAAPEPQQQRQRAVIDGRTGLRIGGIAGNFRTLCVRTCDGYFFPISYGVPSSAFERDQNACAAMCPGTEVELYRHRVPEEESSDMVSVSTGLPYRDLANAWRYRDANASSTPGCGCAAHAAGKRGFEVIGGSYPADARHDASTAAAALPAQPPKPAEDPERQVEPGDALDSDDTRKPVAPPLPHEERSVEADRAVRVVGPTFLPDPEEAIDLRAPAQPIAR